MHRRTRTNAWLRRTSVAAGWAACAAIAQAQAPAAPAMPSLRLRLRGRVGGLKDLLGLSPDDR